MLQADGGTRCASITGACVALADAIAWCSARGLIAADPRTGFVAAVSVGVVGGVPVLDLDYAEDSDCGTDMNVVMTESGGFVELRTAEGDLSAQRDGCARHAADQGIRALSRAAARSPPGLPQQHGNFAPRRAK